MNRRVTSSQGGALMLPGELPGVLPETSLGTPVGTPSVDVEGLSGWTLGGFLVQPGASWGFPSVAPWGLAGCLAVWPVAWLSAWLPECLAVWPLHMVFSLALPGDFYNHFARESERARERDRESHGDVERRRRRMLRMSPIQGELLGVGAPRG